MNILFLTNLLPYPLDNGGKIKTYTTIDTLSKAGHRIDLVCFTEEKNINEKYQSEMLKLCNRVEQIYHKLTTVENKSYMMILAAVSLLSRYSFGVYKFKSNEMKKRLALLCQENKYDCIYFDHLQMCTYKDYLLKLLPNAKLILDEHNCETLIMSRNADLASNSLKKAFLRFEAKKLRNFESKMLDEMDTNIVLSEEDYAELKNLCGKEFNHTIIPIGVQDHGVKKFSDSGTTKLNILFLGTLTWEPNNQGLIWFLSNVMPQLVAEHFCFNLYIVGKKPSAEVKKLAEQYDNVTVTGYVESVDEYYDKCDCMIVPLFIGSGQRVKLIEGFSKGMPAISTSVGAEGLEVIDGQNILVADTPEAFKEAIYKMNDTETREKIALAARRCYEKNYSLQAIAKRLNAVIDKIH